MYSFFYSHKGQRDISWVLDTEVVLRCDRLQVDSNLLYPLPPSMEGGKVGHTSTPVSSGRGLKFLWSWEDNRSSLGTLHGAQSPDEGEACSHMRGPHGGRMLDEHSAEHACGASSLHTRTLGTCQLPQGTVNTK